MANVDSIIDRLLEGTAASYSRADARSNLRRLVEAAREAVAEVGMKVTAHDIARRAGVGIGTFYRRVRSRDLLLEAVLIETVEDMISLARAAKDDCDPWRGFQAFAMQYVQLRMTSCGLNAALGDTALNLEPQLRQLREALRSMVARAQAAGAMRKDVSWEDVAFLLSCVQPARQTIGLNAAQTQWQRTLAVLLDGLIAR
ncbi:MAG: TetR/AcrR family transcriptional regulator [Acidimicrobiales bacterium]|nr:MAG: TetR/AcrR family transcriptional regulator [Acidimicrobiales bacterium]